MDANNGARASGKAQANFSGHGCISQASGRVRLSRQEVHPNRSCRPVSGGEPVFFHLLHQFSFPLVWSGLDDLLGVGLAGRRLVGAGRSIRKAGAMASSRCAGKGRVSRSGASGRAAQPMARRPGVAVERKERLPNLAPGQNCAQFHALRRLACCVDARIE